MTTERYLNSLAAAEGLDISVTRGEWGFIFNRGSLRIGRAYHFGTRPGKILRAYVLSLREFGRLQKHIDRLRGEPGYAAAHRF